MRASGNQDGAIWQGEQQYVEKYGIIDLEAEKYPLKSIM